MNKERVQKGRNKNHTKELKVLHIPFLGGLVLGAGAVWLLNQNKTKEKLKQGREYMSEKIGSAAKKAKALKECIEKKSSDETETNKEE